MSSLTVDCRVWSNTKEVDRSSLHKNKLAKGQTERSRSKCAHRNQTLSNSWVITTAVYEVFKEGNSIQGPNVNLKASYGLTVVIWLRPLNYYSSGACIYRSY